jgi:uncharacterized Fe-S cluster-containing radical SAM superfamily protein
MTPGLTITEIKQINLEMAGGCNLKCPMCPQSFGREKDFLKRLPLEAFRKIIDQAIPVGLRFVNLSGSGEPLLHAGLEDAVAYLASKNLVSMLYTNGYYLTPERFERLAQAGLSICKVSCQGWDRESYAKWMSVDAFDKVREQLKGCVAVRKAKGYATYLQTNHLVHDYGQREYQTQQYITNWVEYLGVEGEVWLEHNWSGQYQGINRGEIFSRQKRSCGRPMGSVVEIRAGGLGGKCGAVVPCPFVLGQDSKAVLGHTSETPLIDIVNGAPMKALRAAHLRKDFDSVDYCKDCDQLLEVEESLVWTNIPGRTYGPSRISGINYLDFSPDKQEAVPQP